MILKQPAGKILELSLRKPKCWDVYFKHMCQKYAYPWIKYKYYYAPGITERKKKKQEYSSHDLYQV